MFCRLGKIIRTRPRATVLLLSLTILVGTGAGFYGYAASISGMRRRARTGRPAEARHRLELCLSVWPRSSAVHLLAARAARLSEDYEAAEAHLKKCMTLQHRRERSHAAGVSSHSRQTGEEDEVAPLLQRLVAQKHPEAPLILETLARVYMHNLRDGPAYAILNRWIELEPGNAKPFHWRGWILERLHNDKLALKDYEQRGHGTPAWSRLTCGWRKCCWMISEPSRRSPTWSSSAGNFPTPPTSWCGWASAASCKAAVRRPAASWKRRNPGCPTIPRFLSHLARLDSQEGRPAEARTLAAVVPS